ncbi:MAG: hypothetical protein SOW59_08640 [Corynebacterium sp.]|nr:hypothetical protein [Corynebacterium sp.]
MAKKKPELTAREHVSEFLEPLFNDDSFLTELSLGHDSSAGDDELSRLLLDLREDINRPAPAAPVIEGAELEPEVTILSTARRRRNRPMLHGLIGAAAATVVIASSGAAIYNAGPGSALYGANQAVFGANDAAIVDLASTLEEMESAAANGDMASTRALLEEARRLANQARGDRRAAEDSAATQPARVTTVTRTVEPAPENATENQSDAGQSTTITERVTETAIVTATVVETVVPNPLPQPSAEPEPAEPIDGGEGLPALVPPQMP